MINSEERVVAVIEPQTTVGEDKLAVEVSDIEVKAGNIVLNNDDDFKRAGEFGVLLKSKIAEVTDFFAPMKKSAHDAHKQICDREKQMLAPLKNAEKVLKQTIGAYTMKKEQERKAAEEAARKQAQEEADRKLAESIEAENNGDTETAKSAMLDAEMADSFARNITVEPQAPKVKGVSTAKDYEIISIDESKVPVSVSGIVIRPVDVASVKRLIKASKGTIKIDGIEYKEVVKTSFRRS